MAGLKPNGLIALNQAPCQEGPALKEVISYTATFHESGLSDVYKHSPPFLFPWKNDIHGILDEIT